MVEETYSQVTQLQALVKEIKKENVSQVAMDDLSEKLLGVLSHISAMDTKLLNQNEQKKLLPQIEDCAVNIWNLAVAKKTGGSLTKTLNARLRHIASSLTFLCSMAEGDKVTYQKQSMMALKTARAWLDTGNSSMAGNPLSMASQALDTLSKLLAKQGSNAEEKQGVQRDQLKVLCYQAEAALLDGQHESALNFMEQAKAMLSQLPKEGSFVTMLCYNFGVDCYQKQQFEAAVTWLRLSYDMGEGKENVGSKNQARTLRLLANAYLEWDSSQHRQKALSAVGLANASQLHPAGLYLKMRILLLGPCGEDRLKAGMDDILHHPELSVDLGLNTVRLLLQHDRTELAFNSLKELTICFKNSPNLGHIHVSHLEALLQCKQVQEAKQLTEACITGHNTGQPLDMPVRKQFHLVLWEQAAHAFETKDFSEALQWYNYSLSLFSSEELMDKNVAKLHRNRAACYLALGELDKASEAIENADKSDQYSPNTQYLLFKIAVLNGHDEQAISAVQKMCECASHRKEEAAHAGEVHVHGLISMAAQLAFEQSNCTVAVKALEGLVEQSPHHQQVLTALRCLIRLKLTYLTDSDNKRKDIQVIARHINTAYDQIMKCAQDKNTVNSSQDETTWFMKMAWNLALQCEDYCEDMLQFFLLCSKLSSLGPHDMASLVRQKTCLFMAAAACLQRARELKEQAEKEQAWRQALEHVSECQCVCGRIEETCISKSDSQNKDSAMVLLMLYEFEAKAKLGEPSVEAVLEKALALPHSEPKTFETMAALAVEPPADQKNVSTRALKVAIKKHLQAQPPDFTQCSKVFHSLIQLTLQSGNKKDPASRKEAWGYFMDVLDIIQSSAKGNYPEMEILWLMTKAWNCGIHLYSGGHFVDAGQWCELSLKLLKHLGPLKSNYESQMTTVYGEVLAKLEANRAKQAVNV